MVVGHVHSPMPTGLGTLLGGRSVRPHESDADGRKALQRMAHRTDALATLPVTASTQPCRTWHECNQCANPYSAARVITASVCCWTRVRRCFIYCRSASYASTMASWHRHCACSG